MKLDKMTIGYTFLFLLLIYIIICIVIFFKQRSLMYHPSENNYLDENQLNHKVEQIIIPSDNQLNSWYFEKDKNFKTLLFFHGNAGSLENRIYKLNNLINKNNILDQTLYSDIFYNINKTFIILIITICTSIIFFYIYLFNKSILTSTFIILYIILILITLKFLIK